MTDEPVYKEEYKGHAINIFYDSDPMSPNDCGDDSLFLTANHRDFYVKRDNYSESTLGLLFTAPIDLDADEKQTVKDIKKQYHVFGLEAYIHSGISLALSREGRFPDRAWDVSQLGAVFVAKNEWPTTAKARAAALSLIAEWNDYLSGNTYGFRIDEAGDSCFGFSGDYNDSGILDEARGAIDYLVEEERKTKTKLVKAMIVNRVPFLIRQQKILA